MELAFIAAMGGVGFEDVAVAGFEFLQDGTFVYDTGAAVVGEARQQDRIFTVLGIQGAELAEIFS